MKDLKTALQTLATQHRARAAERRSQVALRGEAQDIAMVEAHELSAAALEAIAGSTADTRVKLEQHGDMLRAEVPETDEARRSLEAELRALLGRFADTPAMRLAQELVAREFPHDGPRDREDPRKIERMHELYAAAVKKAQDDPAPLCGLCLNPIEKE